MAAGRSVSLAGAALVTCGLVLLAAGTARAQSGAERILKKFKPAETGTVDGNGVYHLSAEELSYTCKKLTGRMQVRILQIRDYEQSKGTSLLSRGLETAGGLFYGPSKGGDSPARYREDRAMLEAFNRRLAEKKCKTFDLDAELRPKPVGETPVPRKAP